jgi:hypothetical protein
MSELEVKEFLMTVRQALLMICAWIEKKYDLRKKQ